MTNEFKQGDIIWFNFPKEISNPQFTIKGPHPALILQDHSAPNHTVILSPLSSLRNGLGEMKELKSYHLKLLKTDYPALTNDSYVKLDQIMTFSRNKIKNSKHICTLSEKDISSSHLKLMEALQMQDTLSEITRKQIEISVEAILEELVREMKGS
ncbi:type II toxin-antitoxin system PemK/MazF family toxin [Bacillus subtilis]|uniref:type II toxin-antitoxin system PemK/MazF family toxin n=1 Tax=Bacillus subtilis TaxID=1423 RepID=UPI003EC0E97F